MSILLKDFAETKFVILFAFLVCSKYSQRNKVYNQLIDSGPACFMSASRWKFIYRKQRAISYIIIMHHMGYICRYKTTVSP